EAVDERVIEVAEQQADTRGPLTEATRKLALQNGLEIARHGHRKVRGVQLPCPRLLDPPRQVLHRLFPSFAAFSAKSSCCSSAPIAHATASPGALPSMPKLRCRRSQESELIKQEMAARQYLRWVSSTCGAAASTA